MIKSTRTPEQDAALRERCREAHRKAAFGLAWRLAVEAQEDADDEEKRRQAAKLPD